MKSKQPKLINQERVEEHIKKLRHPFVIPIVTFFVLFFGTIAIFIGQGGVLVGASDTRVVELSIDGNQQTIPTIEPTVGDLLNKLNIKLNPGDIVEPDQTTPILTNDFKINVFRVHSVTVVEGGQKQVVLTASNDPRSIAQQAGFTTYPEDYVTPTTNAPDINQNVLGEEITVDPATPVTIDLYGTQASLRTHAKTVGELLSDEKINTKTGSNVLPSLATPITSGLQVIVVPVGQQLVSTQQSVPFTVQTNNDPSLPFGQTVVTQAGVNGTALAVYSLSGSGANQTKTLVQQVVVTQPINEIINRGTGITAIAGGNNITWLRSSNISTSDYTYVDYIVTHESHWNPDDISYNGCIGLGQSCGYPPGLAVVCPDWGNDAVCQLNFFNGYAIGRYGSWYGAQVHWENYGWW